MIDGRRPVGRRISQATTRPAGDRGSGTVLLLGVVAAVLVVAAALGLLVGAERARQRAQTAADLAALAGAGRLRVVGAADDLDGSGACDVARSVAKRNGAELVACRDEGRGVLRVRAAVASRAGAAEADARAGPASARGS